MFSRITNITLKVLCPKNHCYVDFPLQYITKDGKLYIANSAGCDFGYNGSKECKKCISDTIAKFKTSFSEH